jgi:hypothetical protein
MKVVRILSRIIVGAVFIYSGFVKGIDPLGSTYKFHDYFVAFGIDFLNPIAFPLSMLLSSAEFIFGISLIFNFRPKFGIWGLLLFMSLFTPLTLILAITNPVSDCGCFGDAIILTNWETFLKNLVILTFVLVLFLSRHKFQSPYSFKTEWGILGIIYSLFIVVSISSYRHLPIMDFRPYRIGTYIPEKMEIPEDAEIDQYETILIYEKDGVQKEFTMENFPWQDSTWTFVDQQSYLIKEGYSPLIHDFEIISEEGNNITDFVLHDPRYTFLMISYNISDANQAGLEKANDLAIFCAVNDYHFYALTSSSNEEVDLIKQDLNLTFDFHNTDETTLKTIIRSNPGFLLLKEGTIVGKWHHHDLPVLEELNDHFIANLLEEFTKKLESSKSYNLLLLLFLGVALVEIIRRSLPENIRKNI